MASCGSVIPLFTELIKNGLPITIKDSCMTRFMLSLPDAVELVLFTFDNGKEGDLFIQIMRSELLEHGMERKSMRSH